MCVCVRVCVEENEDCKCRDAHNPLKIRGIANPFQTRCKPIPNPLAGGRAALWQLGFAFVSGGLFVTSIFAAFFTVYAIGAANEARLKAQFRFVWRRSWQIAVTMLGAASVALVRVDAPCISLDREYSGGAAVRCEASIAGPLG